MGRCGNMGVECGKPKCGSIAAIVLTVLAMIMLIVALALNMVWFSQTEGKSASGLTSCKFTLWMGYSEMHMETEVNSIKSSTDKNFLSDSCSSDNDNDKKACNSLKTGFAFSILTLVGMV